MPLLSLDVGFANLGWVLWDQGKLKDMGVIVTKKATKKSTRTADDYSFRSTQLARQLSEIIESGSVQAIVGELPSGGAQSAKAMAQMAMATAIVSSVASILNLPVEWCTPNDVKLAVYGQRSATKKQMMDTVIEKIGGERCSKKIKSKKSKTGYNLQFTYVVNGYKFGATMFEHIADAIGAYWALRDGNLVKLFG